MRLFDQQMGKFKDSSGLLMAPTERPELLFRGVGEVFWPWKGVGRTRAIGRGDTIHSRQPIQQQDAYVQADLLTRKGIEEGFKQRRETRRFESSELLCQRREFLIAPGQGRKGAPDKPV
jgi:hypothetical protein